MADEVRQTADGARLARHAKETRYAEDTSRRKRSTRKIPQAGGIRQTADGRRDAADSKRKRKIKARRMTQDIIIEANDDPEGYSGGTHVDHGTAKRRKSTPLKCRLVVKQRKQQQQQYRSCNNNSIAQCTSAKALGVVARGTTNRAA